MANRRDASEEIAGNTEMIEMEEMEAEDETEAEEEMEERFDESFWLMVRICKIVFVA